MKISILTVSAVFIAASAFAHVAVAPQQSQAGASQVYKVRVHNDEKSAVTSVELDVPADVTILSVAPMAAVKSTMAKTGDRITSITWQTSIATGKYVELAFTARNPASGQLPWIVREHLADGSINEWSDKPGAEGKASVTKILAATAAAPAK